LLFEQAQPNPWFDKSCGGIMNLQKLKTLPGHPFLVKCQLVGTLWQLQCAVLQGKKTGAPFFFLLATFLPKSMLDLGYFISFAWRFWDF
jgi:hypothetical protein